MEQLFEIWAGNSRIVTKFEKNYIPEPNSGCWLWVAGLDGRGYGNFKAKKAHRFSYFLHRGLVPNGLELDHLCKNKCCINPDHLEPVTRRENILRGTALVASAAFNRSKTHCKNGHPFDEQNTYWDARGHRNCRACHCTWSTKHYVNKIAQAVKRFNQCGHCGELFEVGPGKRRVDAKYCSDAHQIAFNHIKFGRRRR